jgi:hypothetical protein
MDPSKWLSLGEKQIWTDALGVTRKIEGGYSAQGLVFWNLIESRGMSVILGSGFRRNNTGEYTIDYLSVCHSSFLFVGACGNVHLMNKWILTSSKKRESRSGSRLPAAIYTRWIHVNSRFLGISFVPRRKSERAGHDLGLPRAFQLEKLGTKTLLLWHLLPKIIRIKLYIIKLYCYQRQTSKW